jgi:hypothetical protein
LRQSTPGIPVRRSTENQELLLPTPWSKSLKALRISLVMSLAESNFFNLLMETIHAFT